VRDHAWERQVRQFTDWLRIGFSKIDGRQESATSGHSPFFDADFLQPVDGSGKIAFKK
jgi:hypothetical protein